MFEIWRHVDSGERFLVLFLAGLATAAAGPLQPHEDARRVLATRAHQVHNAGALLTMRRAPGEYMREYASARPAPLARVGLPPPGTTQGRAVCGPPRGMGGRRQGGVREGHRGIVGAL